MKKKQIKKTSEAVSVATSFIKMTGPHHGQTNFQGRPCLSWEVAAFNGNAEEPVSKVYRVFSYLKAVRLSCGMAFDRRSHLRMEALPC